MKRRVLLVAVAATGSIAGCLDDGGGSGDDATPTPTETATPTETSTPTETETPEQTRLVDREFEVTRVECGSEYGEYDVTTEDGVVTVEGTLDGRNTCYTAELVESEYDPDADELYVEVESVEDREDGEACAECIVEIDYVARFEFENGEPSNVRVEQRGASDEAGDDGNETETETDGGQY
jgi:hypothetical protein